MPPWFRPPKGLPFRQGSQAPARPDVKAPIARIEIIPDIEPAAAGAFHAFLRLDGRTVRGDAANPLGFDKFRRYGAAVLGREKSDAALDAIARREMLESAEALMKLLSTKQLGG